MKAAGGDKNSDQHKQAEPSLPVKNAVKPAVRAKVNVPSHDEVEDCHLSNDTQGAHQSDACLQDKSDRFVASGSLNLLQFR